MDNLDLISELCYLYAQRNKLQDQRNSRRLKLWRVKQKFNKSHSPETKLLVLQREAELLDTRIAIAKHVEQTHKRIVELTNKIKCRQWRAGDNKIKSLRVSYDLWIECQDFSKWAERYVAQLEVNKMLKGERS